MSKIFLIDSGHGGMIKGEYQTAPDKMYKHEDGSIAFEGVVNAKIKELVCKLLRFENIPFIDINHTELDLSLNARVNIINSLVDQYGANNCILLSLHMNAGKGTGFEIWTSPGATKSDKYASLFAYEFKKHFPFIKIRKDESDGDVDKESAFYILVNSKCPAILPEWLFFDNFEDWVYQRDESNQIKYADMIVDFCKSALILKT